MGCGGSKDPPEVKLTATQIKTVRSCLEAAVQGSKCLVAVIPASLQKMSGKPIDYVYNVARSPQGDDEFEAWGEKVIGDNTIAKDFPGVASATFGADGARSVASLLTAAQQAAISQAVSKIGPELKKSIKDDVDSETKDKAVKRAIGSACDVVLSAVMKSVLLSTQPKAAAPPKTSTPAPATAATAAAAATPQNDRSIAAPSAARSTSAVINSPRPQSEEPAHPYPVPEGDWVKDVEDPQFYFSEKEQLYFFPAAGHFFDGHTQQWYDPDGDRWMTEAEHEQLLQEMLRRGEY